MKRLKTIETLTITAVIFFLCACAADGNQFSPDSQGSTEIQKQDYINTEAQQSQNDASPITSSLPNLGTAKSDTDTKPGSTEDVSSEETEVEDEPGTTEQKAMAEKYIDKPVSELIAELGEPKSAEYAPSCLGDGEDGELVYDGFTVYTYREGDSEIVRGVY